jgi:amino acid adenylation domain-containing protein
MLYESENSTVETAQQKKLLADLLLQERLVDVYPASLAQQRLWFLDQLQGRNSAYNVHLGLWLRGSLDVSSLQSSVQEIVHRHDSLRTQFKFEGGELLQVVVSDYTATLQVSDLTKSPEPYGEAYRLAREESERPFDLSRAPLFRARLFRITGNDHVLLCTMHHIVSDAWSMQILAKELPLIYEALSKGKPSPLPPLPIRYGDYSEWQREWFGTETVKQQLAYWKNKLRNAPPVLELPNDRPRPAEQRFEGACHIMRLSGNLVASIHALAARFHATTFMVLLAAFKILLYRYSGQHDVLVGAPNAGRSRVETEGLIGFFVNTLALRDDLSGNPRFVELLAQVRETTLGAFAHSDVPFEKVVEELQPERSLSYNPIFQVMFSTIKGAVQSHDFGNLTVFPYIISPSTSVFDLGVTLIEGIDGQWWTQVDYSTHLFDSGTILRIQQHFRNLLGAIASDPGQRIVELPMLSAAEERQLVVDLNNSNAEFRHDLCLHHFFEQQAARAPEAVALICGHQRVSYDQLNRRADGLAAYLRRHGVGPEVRVGLYAERSVNLLVGILGILKAGGAYVPLDPAYPIERMRCILEDAGVNILLTQQNLGEKFSGHNIRLIDLDRDWSTIEVEQGKSGSLDVTPQNLAYVLFTSGSTGRAKGVAIEHRSAANLVQWARTVFTAEELSGTLFATSVCFDLSIFEMFVPWSAGGAVILAQNAVSLSELPAAKEVTLINTVPSAMVELLRAGAVPPSVRTVNLAGEALPDSLVRDLYQHTQIRNLYNLYGPTEATTYATYARIGRNADVVIGRPIANTQAYVLDSYGKLVPPGAPGELYLAGENLARGYFGRPDLTAERFVRNPFSVEAKSRLYRTGDLCRHRSDGNIEYRGRLDHQVKLRGFRIELGEIEAILERHPDVGQAIATVRETRETKRLVAYVSAQGDRVPSISELRQHLEHSLPLYMVPDAFVIVNEFPKTANGKVDRRALPAPEAPPMTTVAAPRNEREKMLLEIWERVLDVRPIGVRSNFFDLGGHSLMAARLIAEVQKATGKSISLSTIFRAPTIEGFASVLAEESAVNPDPVLMQLQEGDGVIPFFAIAAPGVDAFGFALLARQMGEKQTVYRLQSRGPGVWGRPFSKQELRAIALEYVEAMRSVQPRGPYCLGGMCEGVLIAQQIIVELESQGESVGLFAVFDTWVLENSQVRLLWAIDYYWNRFRAFRRQSRQEQLAVVHRSFGRFLRRSQANGGSGWKQVYWPARDFQAPRFRAPVLLFKRPRQPYYYIRDRKMGWGARSEGGVEICEINFQHAEVLRQPHVRIIGERLASRLQRIRESERRVQSDLTLA